MVDEALANEVKKLRDDGMSDPKDVLKIFELMKQASAEIDDLKEELEDIDQFIGQMVIEDKDFKWWKELTHLSRCQQIGKPWVDLCQVKLTEQAPICQAILRSKVIFKTRWLMVNI